ncbi:universal stress protein [Hymenobacter terrestris]|uniref:Universal stress protein n=1 Tax=Hymenobacter terrestris TaxID=2748310 RepID=A0ABX2Q8Z6_9BACT|nr:universal stress protein [Hymenobacter terrestris]NVO86217.1 universal stress protein [Hymenobacter terrestris]
MLTGPLYAWFVAVLLGCALSALVVRWQRESAFVPLLLFGLAIVTSWTHYYESELLPTAAPPEVYDDAGHDPAANILRALAESQADLLLLIARPRSFLGRLFHHSVTAQVLHGCAVPVLLLPAHGPDQPDWMPSMC